MTCLVLSEHLTGNCEAMLVTPSPMCPQFCALCPGVDSVTVVFLLGIGAQLTSGNTVPSFSKELPPNPVFWMWSIVISCLPLTPAPMGGHLSQSNQSLRNLPAWHQGRCHLASRYSAGKLQGWRNGQPSSIAWQEASFTAERLWSSTQRGAEKA